MLAALPLGATEADTAEFMLGRVAVVPVLFESNGQIDEATEQWTEQSIRAVLDKIHEGVQWWSDALDTLDTVHSLEFVVDETFAVDPVSTPYEPISRTSQQHPLYVGSFLQEQGFGDAGSLENAVRAFNHRARVEHDTDWAFSIFIVNSFNDADGQFPPGSDFRRAFAFPGGLYTVVPSTRPASTIAHEVGHIFWARDEYPGAGSWTDRRGYYNAQNWNAADNPTPGFEQQPSIMRSGAPLAESFATHFLPDSTMAQVGWRDSNGNGIFDVLDVPLSLQGSGVHDVDSGLFRFEGHATAVALPNENSWGPQNDITLNRIDRIEYRLDGGVWQTAASPGVQAGDVAFELLVGDFSTIDVRAIDDRVGVTSEILTTDMVLPMVGGASLAGRAYLEVAGEGESDPSLSPLAGVSATVSRLDGELLSGAVTAADFGALDPPAGPGAQLTALGHFTDGQVLSVELPGDTDQRRLGFHDGMVGPQHRWSRENQLLVTFESPVGQVSLQAFGLTGKAAYGRLEAYDADGNLLVRSTSDALKTHHSQTLVVRDVGGRIASVRAMGHAGTSVALDNLRYGVETEFRAGDDGVFRFAGLPDGQYQLDLVSQRVIHRPVDSEVTLSVAGGQSEAIAAAFQRVRSPWNNPRDPFDVNDNGQVEALDALLVLNEIAQRRGDSHQLSWDSQFDIFVDTNDDGMLTPLDALVVLNEVARRHRSALAEHSVVGTTGGSESPSGQVNARGLPVDQVLAGWHGDGSDDEEEGLAGPDQHEQIFPILSAV